MKLKKDILWRIGSVYLGMVLLSLYILVQILNLQFVEGRDWKEKEAQLKVEDVILFANRGSILSDDGRTLACSVPGYLVYMDTRATGLTGEVFRKNIDSLSICLSRFYRDKSAAEYKRLISNARKKGNRFFQISKKRISIIDLKKVRNFPIFRLGANKGGFVAVSDDTRKQPFGSLASRTVGKFKVAWDSLGKKLVSGNGLEIAYNKELMGLDGVGDKTKVGGRWVHDIEVEPVDGNDVVSTINIEIQDVADQSLREQLIRHNARYGVAVVMEVETGEIKAMVNLQRTAPGVYVEDHFNYAIGVATEPGSTFKLASLLVAIEDDIVDIDDLVDTGNGTIKYYDRIMRDHEGEALGKITVQEAFEKSSNVGISRIVFENYKEDPEEFIEGLHDLGIGQKLDIEIPGEVAPLIKSPDDKTWSGVTLPFMSIGYESKLTPLQILAFYNAIANDGKMVKPKFVKAIARHGEIIEEFGTEVIKSSVCSGSTLRRAKKLLEGVVERGTAMNLKNNYYPIAGKTGTAQVAQGNKGYKTNGVVSYQASFAGYFPAKDPQYSCIVVVNGPSNNVYYGNVVAGSVFKAISDRLYANSFRKNDAFEGPAPLVAKSYPYCRPGNRKALQNVLSELDIDYDVDERTEWIGTKATGDEVELLGKDLNKKIVPNVKGFGAKDAVILLESLGLKVSILGYGKVTQQSIAPGSKLRKGDRIVLRLT